MHCTELERFICIDCYTGESFSGVSPQDAYDGLCEYLTENGLEITPAKLCRYARVMPIEIEFKTVVVQKI